MKDDLKKRIFLEYCFLPGQITGRKINLDNCELPLVGITGFGSTHKRNENESAWINGSILSPNFIGNDNCVCKSHIEGIATDKGDLMILEAVDNFSAHEEECYAYNLKVKNVSKEVIEFEGEVFSSLRYSKFELVKSGEIYLILNPYWQREEGGTSISPSLPYHNKRMLSGQYVPKMWEEFLGKIEEQGYDHPYQPVSDKLSLEREEREENRLLEALSGNENYGEKGQDDIPF